MAQIPYDSKQCATCAYWCGARDADRFIRRVILPGPDTVKARCACSQSGWSETQALKNAGTCKYYEKWALIK